MIRKDLIDPYKLDEAIDSYKDLYLTSYLNTLKIPSLNKRCEEGLETATEEKKKALLEQIAENNANLKSNEEQMKNLEEMIDSFISFKNSLGQ